MAIVEINGIEEAQSLVGTTHGPCEWREVTQQAIDDFARISGDDQWIHVDVERAKAESPYGQTIAHGNLTLSMIDGMRLELVSLHGAKMGVNYGWNRVRFPAPVPAGSRIRSTIEFVSAFMVTSTFLPSGLTASNLRLASVATPSLPIS